MMSKKFSQIRFEALVVVSAVLIGQFVVAMIMHFGGHYHTVSQKGASIGFMLIGVVTSIVSRQEVSGEAWSWPPRLLVATGVLFGVLFLLVSVFGR